MMTINEFEKIELPLGDPCGYYLNLGNNVLISAPHAVSQTRNGKLKFSEPQTFRLAKVLKDRTNCSVIVKTENLNDDANFEINSNYKNKIASLIEQEKIKYIIDLHGLNQKRSEQINFGTNYGFNLVGKISLFNRIVKTFENKGFKVSKDYPFIGYVNTISGFFSKHYKVFALQIEINSGITFKEESLNNLIEALVETIKIINAYDKLKK